MDTTYIIIVVLVLAFFFAFFYGSDLYKIMPLRMAPLQTVTGTLSVDDIFWKTLPCEDASGSTAEITLTLPSATVIASKVGVGRTFKFQVANAKTLSNVILSGDGIVFSPDGEVNQTSVRDFTGYVISGSSVLIM